jgi:hypothetical protein
MVGGNSRSLCLDPALIAADATMGSCYGILLPVFRLSQRVWVEHYVGQRHVPVPPPSFLDGCSHRDFVFVSDDAFLERKNPCASALEVSFMSEFLPAI